MAKHPRIDAKVRVGLRPTSEGGRKSAIPPIIYRCPVFFGAQRKEANDCVFFLNRIEGRLEPGGPSVVVPVAFLALDLVAAKLHPGAKFTLWEGRAIGDAEVLEVIDRDRGANASNG